MSSDHLQPKQFMDLYHRTNERGAAAAYHHGFAGGGNYGNDVYFSDRLDGKARSYGDHVVHVRVPEDHPYVSHTDEHENGEKWYAIRGDKIDPEHLVPRKDTPKWKGAGM